MIQRKLQQTLAELMAVFPVVTLTGPRQSGKTTLSQMTFPGFNYCNLEHPDVRHFARTDPISFFRQYPTPLIIDEIQRVPELLSYIQVDVDEKRQNGLYLLTGSQQLNLNAAITQSLAGRSAILTLLPFSIQEISQYGLDHFSRDTYLFTGFLPRIYDQQQPVSIAYRSYLQTYLERDIRQLINVKELTTFEKFLKLLAGRVGQLVNLNSLANETGVSSTTINHWLSVLEASYIIFRLKPYHQNFGKRTIKSPKIYFIEPGLACYLLEIEDEKQVARDPLLGGLFENMVIAEALKARYNKGFDGNLYFFRDSNQFEVDLLFKKDGILTSVEIKASMTFNDDFVKNLHRFQKITGVPQSGMIVYGGKNNFTNKDGIDVIGFESVSDIFD